ncbi:hypothetical protein BLNAU_8480 [Blattamonas nauphoetae]|uniref:Uncharacterized protein n=1 Tax=Blattamonas nauphoetae TaxID=2049346 RepID=A0ABQ9XYU3_9EUKA|nr:hypothetical protein BLNAU_8480 [Blattamonas nauphoetae]
MISSEEYSPFLKWNPKQSKTVDSLSQVFNSLVSMVRDGYHFEKKHQRNVTSLFTSITRRIDRKSNIDDFLKAIGKNSADPAEVFVDSVIVLLSSSYESIFMDTLNLTWQSLLCCSHSTSMNSFNPTLARSFYACG